MKMTATTTDIRFECNQCGQRLVVEPAGAGMSMDCPICNTSVIVPSGTDSKSSGRGSRRQGLAAAMTPTPSRSPYADPLPEEVREELIDASPLNGKLAGERESTREEVGRLQQQLKAVAEER